MKTLKTSLLFAILLASTANSKTLQLCADEEIKSIEQVQNRLIVGGRFTKIGPCSGTMVASQALAAYDLDLEQVIPLNVFKPHDRFEAWTISKTSDPSRIVVSDVGRTTVVDLASSARIWTYDSIGGALLATFTYFDRVLFGGDFQRLGGSKAPYFSEVADVDGTLRNWNPRANDSVFIFSFDPTTSKIWIGGDFSKIGSADRPNIAGFDIEGNLLPQSWDLTGEAFENLIAWNGYLFLSGLFETINGVKMQAGIVKVRTSDGGLESWKPDFDHSTLWVRNFDADNLIAFSDGEHPSRLIDKNTGKSQAFYPDLFGTNELSAVKSLEDRAGIAAAQVNGQGATLTVFTP